jgi:16S rRNA (guanine527-N7)-methyltransferase
MLPEGVRLLDIGSGGGLPGVVIAIARPDVSVHLLEATRKKAVFLTESVASLELPVTVHHGRAEELARSALRGSFDLVTARAVAPLERLIPWCAPFLRPEGLLYAIKGERWRAELDAAGNAIAANAMTVRVTPDSVVGPGRDATAPLVVILERASTSGTKR